MKRLLLLRHGKSDWGHAVSDAERPLAPRGEKAAALIGELLAQADEAPDHVVTSPAVRAATTVRIAARAGSWNAAITVREELYGATPDSLLRVVHEQDDGHRSLLLAGHEPTFSSAAGRFAGAADLRVPTAALIGFDFAVDTWRDVAFGRGQLLWLMPPRLLTALR